MASKRRWTLLAIATLGSIAHLRSARAENPADEPAATAPPPSPSDQELAKLAEQSATTEDIATTGFSVRDASHRGAAEGWLVAPGNAELTGALRFVTARAALSTEELRFSDLALFTLAGRYSLGERFELSGHVELLPKQPSYTDENTLQSAGLGARYALRNNLAVAVDGGLGPLLAHDGLWTQQAASVQWRKAIDRNVMFDLSGGGNAVELSAPGGPSAAMTELTSAGSVLFGDRMWAAWLGAAYTIPIWSGGKDPTTARALDPQPRLDFRIGTVLVIDRWDLSAEYLVIDRGDLSNAATRLPVLDGGFDQRQILFSVTRHFDRGRSRELAARTTHDRRAVATR